MSESQIVAFLRDKTVFLTGGTGFLGKILLEKLLRVCDVKVIYVLVRQKKGKQEADRYREIFEFPLFEKLKQERPDYLAKVHMIIGDCAVERMGISDENWTLLEDETNVVIHCAATIRFDQALRTAFNINIRATRDLVNAAKRMRNLQSFIHVSTAYSNCPREDIGEMIYKPPLTDQQLELFLKAIESDDMVNRMTPSLLGEWPNTYSFTKCIGEEMVARLAQDDDAHPLPVAIVRPSIIISTCKEPMVGWIDNFYGPIGVTSGVALGLLRTLHCIPENRADMVPADYVVNSILAAAWVTSLRTDNQVEVYNYCSGEHSITWDYYMTQAFDASKKLSSMKIIWHPIFTLNPYGWKHQIDSFLMHTLPAHIVDFICKLLGKPQRLVDGYKRIDKFIAAINFFTLRQWNFGNEKMSELWKRFNDEDKKLFEIRISTFTWSEYMYDFMVGGRIYLLRDPLSTLPKSMEKRRKLQIAHWTLMSVLVLLFVGFLYFVYAIFIDI